MGRTGKIRRCDWERYAAEAAGGFENAFSQNLENHCRIVAIYFAYYDFCRVHQTLRVTPAMQAGLADHMWIAGKSGGQGGMNVTLRDLAVELIRKVPTGTVIKTQNIQSAIYKRFPHECEALGFTPVTTKPIEEKWKKDIRFALQDAKHQKLIRHTGSSKSGLWERI